MSGGIAEIERRLLAKCARQERYASEFTNLKAMIDRLVERGDLVRAKAPGSTYPMLVRITDAGRARLATLERA